MRSTRPKFLKAKFSLHYTRRFHSYLTEDTLRFHYNEQKLNALCGGYVYLL